METYLSLPGMILSNMDHERVGEQIRDEAASTVVATAPPAHPHPTCTQRTTASSPWRRPGVERGTGEGFIWSDTVRVCLQGPPCSPPSHPRTPPTAAGGSLCVPTANLVAHRASGREKGAWPPRWSPTSDPARLSTDCERIPVIVGAASTG